MQLFLATATNIMTGIGVGASWFFVWLLCAAGIVLSGVSISGTWLVLLGAAIAGCLRPNSFPGWITLVVFLLLAVGVEIIEAVASSWGVKRRGGSNIAGIVAVIGSFVGMLVGGAVVPIPVIGSLLGMLVLGFASTFAVEAARLKRSDHAARIAFGSVTARVLVSLVKVAVTMGMTLILLTGVLFSRS
jgi:uncharacterized protein YqgC (DUF456 family)